MKAEELRAREALFRFFDAPRGSQAQDVALNDYRHSWERIALVRRWWLSFTWWLYMLRHPRLRAALKRQRKLQSTITEAPDPNG